MKRSRFTEEQILFALKQADSGQAVSDVCRQMGVSEATFYAWKKCYADLGVLELRELRQLRAENARLKRLVADLTLDRHVLRASGSHPRKDLAARRRREIARWAQECYRLSVRRGPIRNSVF